jgi:hypothetical protein
MSDYVFQARLGRDGKYGFASFEPVEGIWPEVIAAMLNAGTAWLDGDAIIAEGRVIADLHDSWIDESTPDGELWMLHPDDVGRN